MKGVFPSRLLSVFSKTCSWDVFLFANHLQHILSFSLHTSGDQVLSGFLLMKFLLFAIIFDPPSPYYSEFFLLDIMTHFLQLLQAKIECNQKIPRTLSLNQGIHINIYTQNNWIFFSLLFQSNNILYCSLLYLSLPFIKWTWVFF